MIYIIVGGVGSGKSLGACKTIIDRGCKAYTNFDMIGVKGYHRLKYSDIISSEVESVKKDGSPKKMKVDVNFKYWEKQMKGKEGFDIYVDELQSVANSRRSQSTENVIWGKFISQIRKMLGSTEKNNIYLITQRPGSIDIQFRELAHVWILCNKVTIHAVELATETPEGVKMLPMTIIVQNYFRSLDELEIFNRTDNDRIPFMRKGFIGNNYYKYYNSYALIDFSGEYV